MNIDGKLIAKQLREKLTVEVAELKAKHGVQPSLTVIIVGDDPASHIYVKNKVKQTQEVGMISNEILLPANTTEQYLLQQLEQLNNDASVHGILVQLPLPKHLNESAIISAINPDKDVDGFHAVNSGRLFNGESNALVPCTPQGCVLLAKHHIGDDLTGLHAVIIGRSNIVGKPVAMLFLQENCTITIAHSKTKNLDEVCKQADILVAAVGIAQFVKADWVKKGATVIDVGINRIITEDGKTRLVGDVDFDNVVTKCGAITPVPGGVGPMTIACLLKNTLVATKRYLT